MKVIVTGANGFLGSHLCKKLILEGLDVVALVRPKSDLRELVPLKKLEYVQGDISDKNSLQEALKVSQAEAVFHLAGFIGYKKSERELMEMINVQGTQNLIECMMNSHIQKLVHMSSVVAVGAGFTSDQILDEDSAYNLSNLDLGYFETKRKAEILILNAVKAGNIQSVILNPSTIYGPADAKKPSRKTQVKVAQGKFNFYTSGGVSIVSVEDVIEGIYQGFVRGRNGQRYILSGENITIKDLFERIANLANVEPPKIYMPNWILHGIGMFSDQLGHLGIKASLSRDNAWTATMFHWFKNDKAKKELGLNFKPANYALSQSVNWMRENKII